LRGQALRSFDLVVIGGGINGVGVARDAAGRGLSVLLAEKGDLAGATSSASSKLIHGGLRYLERYEFRLVAEALAEREVLLRTAGHLVWSTRFVMPHVPELRPRWMIRLGLFFYDHLGRATSLAGSRGVRLDASPYGDGLKPGLKHGFVYSDCRVDDARLVIGVARAVARSRRGTRAFSARTGQCRRSVGGARPERQARAVERRAAASGEGQSHRLAATVPG
jgi:glycerol-3-phosphate dehydrogenase